MDLREGFCELSWNLSEGKRGRKTSGKGMRAKLLQSYLTLCNPMDCSPPRSSVHRIFQARVLVWVAMPSSRGSSRPRDRTHVSYVSCIGRWVLYHLCHLGSPSGKGVAWKGIGQVLEERRGKSKSGMGGYRITEDEVTGHAGSRVWPKECTTEVWWRIRLLQLSSRTWEDKCLRVVYVHVSIPSLWDRNCNWRKWQWARSWNHQAMKERCLESVYADNWKG